MPRGPLIRSDLVGAFNGSGLNDTPFAITVTGADTVAVGPGRLEMAGPVTIAGAGLTSGQATVTTPHNSAVYVGQRVYAAAGLPTNTRVTAVTPNVNITLSANATSTASTTLTFEGQYWQFAGGTAFLPHINNGDGEWYIGIDPNTNTSAASTPLGAICSKVHAFRFRIHSSMIWIARVRRTSGVVTIMETYEPKWPTSGIARFKAKCLAAASTTGVNVRVAILGTSLSNFNALTTRLNMDTVPTSTVTDWNSLLFAPDVTGTTAAQNSASYRVPYRMLLNTRFTVDNFSMSSNNIHYHACWAADGILSAGTAMGQAWAVRPGSFDKMASASWRGVRKSPLMTEPYDLVIIDTTPNGGTHKMAHLDNIVRKLKSVGSDVILIRALQTDSTAIPDLLAWTVPDLVKIAEMRGCDVCDWASFHWEAVDRFATRTDAINGGSAAPAYGLNQVFQDTIHPSQNRNGVGLSAEALRSIINDLPMVQKAAADWSRDRVVVPELSLDPNTAAPFFPTHYEFCAFPNEVNGGVTYNAGAGGIFGGSIPANVKMPEIPIGGKTSGSTSAGTAPVMQLNGSGDFLSFSHPFAIGADILVDYNGAAYNFNITDGSTTIVAAAVTTGLGSAKGFLVEGPQVGTTSNWMPAQSTTQLGGPWSNSYLRLTWVSGAPLIRGVLWHLPGEVQDLPAASFTYIGTWVTTTATGGIQSVARASNTTNDSFDVVVDGRLAFIHLEQGPSSGFLDVWVNGERQYTNLDTYVATAQQGYLRIMPNLGGTGTAAPAPRLPELGTSVRMHIRVAYTGSQNVSAAVPSGNNYRLKVVGVSVIK